MYGSHTLYWMFSQIGLSYKKKKKHGTRMGPVLYRLLLTFEPDGETSLGLELDVHPRFPV